MKLSKTQLSKIVQYGRLKGINPFELLRLLKEINDHVGTVLLKNTHYLNSYKVIPKLLLNKGLNILSKKKISSITCSEITLISNEIKIL